MLHEAGRRAWPEIDVPAEDFARHLEALPAAEARHAGDLYLACACALGLPAAVLAFERAYLSQVPSLLAGLSLSAAQVDEVRQRLRHKLLVSDADARPAIAGYSGRGPLLAWLRVAARRAGLSLIGEEGGSAPLPEVPAPAPPPEITVARARYEEAFRLSLQEAFQGLPATQRTALRLHFIEGLPDERIGAVLRVHRTTVTRWIEQARAHVLGETRRRLGERLQLGPAEAESLLGALRSHIDVSLTGLLAPRGQRG